MKSEKAITLESLIIYITVTVLAIGILSKISTVFYNNIQYVDSEGIFAIEYQKFNSSFIEDIKTVGIKTLDVDENEQYVLLYNENTNEQIKYTFTSSAIYRNEARISNKIKATLKKDENNMLSILIEYTGKGNEKIEQGSKVKTLEYNLP